MTTHTPFKLGTVSTGTLRTEDLLPKFADTLEQLGEQNERNEIIVMNARGTLHGYNDRGMLSELEDKLGDLCPPFVYFGAHPGDPADFGFWPDWDALQEARSTHLSDHFKCDGCLIDIDNDNVTVFDLAHNMLWTTT